jgi:Epoxide hydrolase N terminus
MDGPTAIRPFLIDVGQAEVDELRDRLARTRWPDQLPGAGWDYGIALEVVRPRRTLRGHGRARPAGSGRARVLPGVPRLRYAGVLD